MSKQVVYSENGRITLDVNSLGHSLKPPEKYYGLVTQMENDIGEPSVMCYTPDVLENVEWDKNDQCFVLPKGQIFEVECSIGGLVKAEQNMYGHVLDIQIAGDDDIWVPIGSQILAMVLQDQQTTENVSVSGYAKAIINTRDGTRVRAVVTIAKNSINYNKNSGYMMVKKI